MQGRIVGLPGPQRLPTLSDISLCMRLMDGIPSELSNIFETI